MLRQLDSAAFPLAVPSQDIAAAGAELNRGLARHDPSRDDIRFSDPHFRPNPQQQVAEELVRRAWEPIPARAPAYSANPVAF